MLVALLFLLSSFVADASSPAGETPPKYEVGSRIIVIRKTPLMVDERIARQLEPGTPLSVEELKDGYLGVTAGKQGWVDQNDVVLAERSVGPLGELIAKDPDNIMLHELRASMASEQRKWDVAIDDATELIRLEPDKIRWRLFRADLFKEQSQLDKALDDYNEAVDQDPKSAKAIADRGMLWEQKKEFDKAIADFDRALTLDPPKFAKSIILKGRGYAYEGKHDTDKAMADFNEAVKSFSFDPQTFYYRAGLNFHLRKFDEAIADYSASLWLEPQDAGAFAARGECYAAKEQYEPAQADIDKALELEPENVFALECDASLKWIKRDFDRAIEDYTGVIKVEPENPSGYLDRSSAYLEKHDYQKAKDDMAQAIKLNRKLPMALNNLAWLEATCPDDSIRNGKEAVENAVEAVRLTEGKAPGLIDTLGAAYAEAGDFDKAVESQQKAVDLATDDKLRQELRTRLELYRAHKPFRDQTGGASPATSSVREPAEATPKQPAQK